MALMLVGFVAGIYLLSHAVDGLRAQYGGIDGQVAVEDCVSTEDGWRCSGTFVSHDGGTRISAITINPLLDTRPDPPVIDARVSGPGADTARTKPEQVGLQLFGALFFLGVGVLALVAQWRSRKAEAALAPTVVPEPLSGQAAAEPAAHPWLVAASTAAAAGVDAGPTGPNRVVWRVVAGWLCLIAAVVATSSSLDRWNLEQDSVYSEASGGVVTADRLGAEGRIEVTYPVVGGSTRTVRLTPVAPEAFPTGTKVPVFYHPDFPDEAIPSDQTAFVIMPRGRTVFAGILIVIGFFFVVAWTWRLIRWALGALPRRTEPAVMIVTTGEFVTTGASLGPSAFWLILTDPFGARWYQRVLWDRRLVNALARGPSGFQPTVTLRRCPGFRRMYLVDVPGVGRLLPASTARARTPRNYVLEPFDVGGFRGYAPMRRLLPLGAGMGLVGAVMAVFAGLAAAVLSVVLIFGYLLWSGAVPLRGFYLR